MGVTLVVTPYWIRFAIHCFDECELIASCLSITNYDQILYSSLINANAMFPIVCIASRDYTIHSCPSTQQITNLIKYRVETGVIPTYNRTNTPNKLLSHQFTCNVTYTYKLLKLPCFSAVLLYTQLLIVLHSNNPKVNLIPITTPFPTHIPSIFYN